MTPSKLYDKAFEALWLEMDHHYSYFSLKKDVDWNALRLKYRPCVLKATSVTEFMGVLKAMLSQLKDMHVWIEHRGEILPTYRIPWQPNFNLPWTLDQLAESVQIGPFAIVGTIRLAGPILGYLVILKQSAATKTWVRKAIAQIRKRHTAAGFIVDLRVGCNGGDERLAQMLAKAFCSQETVYAKHQYRTKGQGRWGEGCGGNGEKAMERNGETANRRDVETAKQGDGARVKGAELTFKYALGEVRCRILRPAEKPYTKPVVCLIGKGCMSSGEGLVLMLQSLPQVTTLGERTRGASGNPKPFKLRGLGISVWFSCWVDLAPEGVPFEGAGIQPKVELKFPPNAFQDADPLLTKAIIFLTPSF